uniref:Ureidoglycolate hydrolase n=1 Tax=Coccolithus braarudii TaxID=221442 RepID=A0A7S0LM43_9EUKA|mmetsp:Transcript_4792/g.10496  ORF Transcript_4792/g.10496 Transcript_4792/m.10496 type:complete len:276 (+) Transcript_4792:3-830(+)
MAFRMAFSRRRVPLIAPVAKLLRARQVHANGARLDAAPFKFSAENFRDPQLPHGLEVRNVPLTPATEEALQGYGRLISTADEISVENGNFEIVRWPQPGWRELDPQTGDEAGTTEGNFEVHWSGDFYYAHNLAINTENNYYLDGISAPPELARRSEPAAGDGSYIYLWMSDYHPDGAQLFFPAQPIPFVVCLGSREHGDDIKPGHMRAFAVPAGKGIYLDPSTWHNGVYVAPCHTPARFLTRQGRVHARVSCSWAAEYHTLLRVPLVATVDADHV